MVLIIIAIVVFAWLLVGALSISFSGIAAPKTERVECDVCGKLDLWWNGLSVFGKIIGAAWYGINKLACVIKGCRGF